MENNSWQKPLPNSFAPWTHSPKRVCRFFLLLLLLFRCCVFFFLLTYLLFWFHFASRTLRFAHIKQRKYIHITTYVSYDRFWIVFFNFDFRCARLGDCYTVKPLKIGSFQWLLIAAAVLHKAGMQSTRERQTDTHTHRKKKRLGLAIKPMHDTHVVHSGTF